MLTSLGLQNVTDAVAPGWIFAVVLVAWGGDPPRTDHAPDTGFCQFDY